MDTRNPGLHFAARRAWLAKLAGLFFALAVLPPADAHEPPTEIHQRLAVQAGENVVALTLDACGGRYDAELIATLVEFKVPATIFLTRKWAARNAQGIAALRAHPELFQLEDHGAEHVPAVLGREARVFGLKGAGSSEALEHEVEGGAAAIRAAGAPRPTWFRGATARYDAASLRHIARLGYRVAGFSLNADAGASLPRAAVKARLLGTRPGDIVIAHMNKPDSETAEALRDALPVLLARGMRFVKLESRAIEVLPAPRTR